MSYIDGFLIPVPKAQLDDYLRIARKSGEMWMEHGALHYVEGVADDVKHGKWTDFYRAVDAKEDETVIFSFVVYASREARDALMTELMPKLEAEFKKEEMPFDGKRMIFGGFRSEVEFPARGAA